MDIDVKLCCIRPSVKNQLSGGKKKKSHSSFMLLLFMEKEVHKPRCIPGASSIFGLLFIWLDADKGMLFGRRRVELCKTNPRSPAEAPLPWGHRDQRPHAGDSPRVPWGRLQHSVPVAEVLFLESTEFSACVTHPLTNLLCPA